MILIKATYEWTDGNEIAVMVELDPSIMSYEEEIWPCAVDKARDKLHDINKEFGENAKLVKLELIAD